MSCTRTRRCKVLPFFQAEATIRPCIRDSISTAVKPAGLLIRETIECRYIGFDVKEWCPVKNINILDDQLTAIHAHEPHDREADRIRAPGGPGCKDTMRFRIEEGNNVE